jgi:hypothetical protein
MLFGLTWSKMIVVVAIAILLFGVPLLGFLVAVKARLERRKGKER